MMRKGPETILPAPGEGENASVTLAVENVVVSRRRVAGDLVRLSVTTQTKEHLVDEELSYEEVLVEHVAIGRVVDAAPDVRVDGDVTIVPVMREEVVMERRLILVEEIHMRRVRVTGRHRETVILREQIVEVTRTGAGRPEPTDGRLPDPTDANS